jgi:hypothetical protein
VTFYFDLQGQEEKNKTKISPKERNGSEILPM